jgi:hypothetical protein
MENGAPSGAKVDRRIEAEPIEINGWRIQLVARLVGWEVDGGSESSPFMSRVGRLMPAEVLIDSGEGQQEVISIEDPLQEPIRGILAVSAIVSVVCVLVMLATQIFTRGK